MTTYRVRFHLETEYEADSVDEFYRNLSELHKTVTTGSELIEMRLTIEPCEECNE